MPGFLEKSGKPVAQVRIEALARREHQAGDEPADRIAAREQRHAAAFLQLQDAERMVVERGLVDLEQLVARIGIEDGQQRLAVMTVGVEARPAQHAVDPAAQQRHVLDARVIGGRGEQPDQAAFTGHAALDVVGLDDRAIHRATAVDQAGTIRLDDQDVVGPAGEARHRLAAAEARLEQADIVAVQDAECRAGHELVAQAARLARILDVAVTAMAEEGEVVGLEPMEEVFVFAEPGRAAGQKVVEGIEAGLAERPPVLDCQPHLGQHTAQRGGKIVELGAIGQAVDLEIHHRFRPRPFAGFVRNLDQIAVEVAPHRQHRMGQQMHADFAAIELVGDRIDKERHVVVDHLHDRAGALEAVVGRRWIEHPHLGDPRQAAAGEGQQGGCGGGALVGGGGREILVGHAFEQAAGELRCFLAAGTAERCGADGIQPPNTRRQWLLPLRCPLNSYDEAPMLRRTRPVPKRWNALLRMR